MLIYAHKGVVPIARNLKIKAARTEKDMTQKALAAAIPVIIWLIRYYYRNIAYICPECHEVFKLAMKEFIFTSHTLKTRKLTCVKCGHKGYCVETYGGNVE